MPPSCRRCRGHHLRCTGGSPCDACQKANAPCDPAGSRIRFRSGPRPRPSYDFAPDQKWVNPRRSRRLMYVDMTPRLRQGDTSAKSPPQTPPATSSKGPGTAISASDGGKYDTRHHLPHEQTPPSHQSAPTNSTPNQLHPLPTVHVAPLHQRSSYPPGPLYGLPQDNSDSAYLSLEEACLIRHFTENLAPWLDASDCDRHFGLFVPERAMFCPVLRYAIYTLAAGHLARLAWYQRRSTEVITKEGIVLTGITPHTAIRYHDTCISYLMAISKDPAEEFNEDVLAAATILRLYEEIDAPLIGGSETHLDAIQFIVDARRSVAYYSYQTIQGPPRDDNVHASPCLSLRHSVFLNILRQEIWSAFYHQRPFRLPIAPYRDYNISSPTNDFVWTNRMSLWVADLLLFCFGDQKHMDVDEKMQRWASLKATELKWVTQPPPAFKPIYYQDRDPAVGQYFPTIWHMNGCQVTGAQHVELGRILLALSDPTRSPPLERAGMQSDTLAEELRIITRRLCGLAVSNPNHPAALVTATVGISVCGKYFNDAAEQDALVRILVHLESEYAWPTETTVSTLRSHWAMTT